jgi:prepilin-type N-terminal cleavage/methylation domain-containing protein
VERQVKRRSRRELGVTLVELLVVVAIVGAMVSIAMPSFTSGLDGLRLSQAADSVAAFLNGGLNRVERRQEVVEISVAPRENRIEMRSADGKFTRRVELPDGVRVEGQPLRLLLLPGATAPRVGIQLANQRGSRRVVRLDPITGVPTIERMQ